MEQGWIKLHRKVLENPLMKKPAYLAVWLDLLLSASHSDGLISVSFAGKQLKLTAGQLTAGAYQIGLRSGVPRGSVERILKRFKSEEMIEERTDGQCTLITVKKWHQYQKSEEANEERVRNDRGTSEERVRTNQECKNGNNDKNEIKSEGTLSLSPAQETNYFFSNLELQEQTVRGLVENGVAEQVARIEIDKFVHYWTELNPSGSKQRWQLEKTFEIQRRLARWFRNVRSFNKSAETKGITL